MSRSKRSDWVATGELKRILESEEDQRALADFVVGVLRAQKLIGSEGDDVRHLAAKNRVDLDELLKRYGPSKGGNRGGSAPPGPT